MRICPQCKLEYRDQHATTCLTDGATLEELPDPRLGTHVGGGRYLLESVLGEGGMATVYRARHTLIERPLAIKVLHKHLAHDTTLRERFRREARSAATIAHENVIEIYDLGEAEDGCPFIAMELLEGEPLRKHVERGPMPVALVCNLGQQMARGLARAHDLGIVHRDLKPENVFISRRADGSWLAKLVDFGIAQSKKDARLTARGSLIGTPQYLAPERIKGDESGVPSDLYSFGVLLFEMLTGRPPFLSEDLPGYLIQHMEAAPPAPSSLVPSVPAALEALVLRLLAKTPAERPVDMHEVVQALEAIAPAPSVSAAAPAPRAQAVALDTPRSLPPITLEHLERRALVYQQILRRAFPVGGPPVLQAGLADMRHAVDQIADLRSTRIAAQKQLDRVEREARDARECLGHAVHELGVDLSTARAELRRAEELVLEKSTEVHDLSFQLEALRKNLDEAEHRAEAERQEANAALERSAKELAPLEAELDKRSNAFLEAIKKNEDTAPLVEELMKEV